MKSGIFVLFAVLILCVSYSSSSEFEYTTIAKTINTTGNKMFNVINSYETPLKLHAVENFNKNDERDNLNSYVTIVSSRPIAAQESRFKSLETSSFGLESSKLETPIIVPYKSNKSEPTLDTQKSTSSENKIKTMSNRKQDEEVPLGFDIDLQNRINDATLQTISAKDAFKVIYPDPKKFTEKLEVKVFDPNYEAMKGAFMTKLTGLLDNNLIGDESSYVRDNGRTLRKNVSINKEDFPKVDIETLEKDAAKYTAENSRVSNIAEMKRRRSGKQLK